MNVQIHDKSFNFNQNDLVLIIGETMGANCIESIRLARTLGASGDFGKILYVNTVQRRVKLRHTVYRALGSGYEIDEHPDGVYFLSKLCGSLPHFEQTILDYIRHDGVRTVVINAWELAAGTSRARERLLFQIQRWLDEYDCGVVMYAQKTNRDSEAGVAERGGFGRLSGFADVLVDTCEDRKPKSGFSEVSFCDGINRMQKSASGKNEFYDEFVFDVETEDDIRKVRTWDERGIPHTELRLYRGNDPKGSERVTLIEQCLPDGRLHFRSYNVHSSDYDFPDTFPTEAEPLLGVNLEQYLARYRKAEPVCVHNDVDENQQLTDRLLYGRTG